MWGLPYIFFDAASQNKTGHELVDPVSSSESSLEKQKRDSNIHLFENN